MFLKLSGFSHCLTMINAHLSFPSITVHAHCYPPVWHCTCCGGTGLPVSGVCLGGSYKRPLICIAHGSLLIGCQQCNLSSHASPVSALIVILSAAVFVYTRPWESLNLQFWTVDTAELSPCNLWSIFWLLHVKLSSAAKWVVHHSGLFPIHGCCFHLFFFGRPVFLLVRLYSYTNLGM